MPTGQEILEVADDVGLRTTFSAVPKRAEDLQPEDLRAAGLRGRVLANAAFCLHHVASEPGERDRVGVLRLLREVGAEGMVLAESDTNHDVDALPARFSTPTGITARSRGASRRCSPPPTRRSCGKSSSRPEVRNVIAFEGAQRTERHQEAETWLAHLRAAGWSPDTSLRDLVPQAAAPPGFEVQNRGDRVALSFRDVDVLCVMRARQ